MASNLGSSYDSHQDALADSSNNQRDADLTHYAKISSASERKKLRNKAAAKGLDPVRNIQHEQDSVMKQYLTKQYMSHERRLEAAPSQLLLEAEVEIVQDTDDDRRAVSLMTMG